MRLLVLTQGADHVCFRYRVGAFAQALSARGWTLEGVPLAGAVVRRCRQLRAARHADAVLLQRKLLPWWQARILRQNARVLLFDFDDAVFHRDSYSPKGFYSRTRSFRFWATVHAADAVLAGNRYLAEQAARFVEPRQVYRIPTCVDPRAYPTARHQRQGVAARLVWIGGEAMLRSLDRASAHLAAAAAAVPGIELHVICSKVPLLDRLRVVGIHWSETTEARDLAAADVGISWLPDDPWSRGKCALKILQYMAAGLPVVANPVGMTREIVVDGETGYLAATPQEWADAITRLASDPAKRQAMGLAGRRRVEQLYSVAAWEHVFAELIDRVAGSVTTRSGAHFGTAVRHRPAHAGRSPQC